MSHRLFAVLTLTLWVLLPFTKSSSDCRGAEVARDALRPNIIYIMTDDLGYGDLGCFGQQVIQTPNIDQMAKEGMRFTDHYAGHTVCRPSRLVLWTGQHVGHTGLTGNRARSLVQKSEPSPDACMTPAMPRAVLGNGHLVT